MLNQAQFMRKDRQRPTKFPKPASSKCSPTIAQFFVLRDPQDLNLHPHSQQTLSTASHTGYNPYDELPLRSRTPRCRGRASRGLLRKKESHGHGRTAPRTPRPNTGWRGWPRPGRALLVGPSRAGARPRGSRSGSVLGRRTSRSRRSKSAASSAPMFPQPLSSHTFSRSKVVVMVVGVVGT
jgi:hypothetical protein